MYSGSVTFSLQGQTINLIQNHSFESVVNCGNLESNCNCFPNPFFLGCLGSPWKNRLGTPAVTPKWVNKGPLAFLGNNYAQTRYNSKVSSLGQGCAFLESFYYDLSQTSCSKLYIGQSYKIELAVNGYTEHNFQKVLNLNIRGANGMVNSDDPNESCTANAGTSSQFLASFSDIKFNNWQAVSSTFTPVIELSQIAFEPDMVTAAGNKWADVMIDAVYLTCESMALTNVTTFVNGELVTFTLNKTGGPSDVSISSNDVEWTFADGSKLTGNPVTKTFANGQPQSLSYWFRDNRCCTGKGNQSFDPPSCNCDGAALVITTNTNWTTNQSPTGNVIIENGAKLNIQGAGASNVQILMKPKCKIIVKTGSLLKTYKTTIDVITNSECPLGLWGGIEVQGAGISSAHPTTSQVLNNTYPATINDHGTVFIDEASIIKRAEHAINSDNKFDASCGGIIVTRGAELRDNLKGITIGRSNVKDNASEIIGGWMFGVAVASPANYMQSKYLFGLRVDRALGVSVKNTDFTQLKTGIDNSFGSLTVDGSDFLKCGTGIYSRQMFLKLDQTLGLGNTIANTFNTCIIGADIYGSYDAIVANSSFTNTIYGVTNRGLGGYITKGNIFNGNAFFYNGLYWESTGETYPVQSYCNQYNDNYYSAINAFKNNSNGIFDFNEFSGNGSTNNASDVRVFGTSNTTGNISIQMRGLNFKSALNLFSPLTKDFEVPFINSGNHEYTARNTGNPIFGTKWVPRCPGNIDPLYDSNCGTFSSNFIRLYEMNNLFDCLNGSPMYDEGNPGNSIGFVQTSIVNINTFIANDPLYLQNSLYLQEMNKKNRAYQHLVRRFNTENKLDSIVTLLNLEPTMDNRLRMLGTLLANNNYTGANQLINTLPDTTLNQLDLTKMLRLGTRYLQSGDENFGTMDIDLINELIQADRNSAAIAQALLGAIDQKSYYLPVQYNPSSGNKELLQAGQVQTGILHPNPSDGNFTLKLERFTKSPYSIMIFDLYGRMIKTFNFVQNGESFVINELISGNYIAIVQNEDGYRKTQRIVILK